MPYLNLDLDFFDHPKTRRLVGILGRGAETLVLRLWAHTAKFHTSDGSLDGYSPEEIESICNWSGEPGKAFQALVRVGFIKCNSNAQADAQAMLVHGWHEHQGHLDMLKRRAKAAAAARWAKAPKNDAPSNAQAMPEQCNEQCPIPIHSNPSNPRNRTPPDSLQHPAGDNSGETHLDLDVAAEPKLPAEVEFWNANCGKLPRVMSFSADRRRHLASRRKDTFWVSNFEAAVQKIAASEFCNGKNDRNWRATFDWVIEQPSTVSKVMEGKYTKSKQSDVPY